MAFRSVPRPSSPPGAKASTECPYRAQHRMTKRPSHAMHRNQPHTRYTRCAQFPSRVSKHRHDSSNVSPLNTPPAWDKNPTARPHLASGQTDAGTHAQSRSKLIELTMNNTAGAAQSHPHRSRSSVTSNPDPSSFSAHSASHSDQRNMREMETIGIEPMTPCLQSRCSPS